LRVRINYQTQQITVKNTEINVIITLSLPKIVIKNMLSICTLKSSSQASQYYQSENYYSQDGEAGYSQWLGKGSEKLGLEGPVKEQDFKNLLDGHSQTGNKLIQGTNGKAHRPGYDLTFSAPKSVSILGIVGNDKGVMDAHRNAVKKVISSIESEFAAYRAKTNGLVNIEKTGNFVVAAFEHIDSRALDPNLHTHCVLMNLTQRSDGAWRTVFGDELYNNKLVNGMQYRVFLAEELMQKGLNVVQTSNKGTFELENFDKALIDQFSKRRLQITDKLQEVGFSGGKAAAIANLDTRSAKTAVNFDNLKEKWSEELKECGSSIEWLKDYSKLSLNREPILAPDPNITAEKAVSAALRDLSEQRAVFNLNQVLKTAKGMTIIPCVEADLLKAIEVKEQKSELLYVSEGLFTTPKARELEMGVVMNAKQGVNQVRPMMSGIEASIKAFFTSTNLSQKEALKLMLTSSDRQIMVSTESRQSLNNLISDYADISKEKRFYPVGLTQSGANIEKFKQNTGLERVNTIEGFIRACESRSEKIQHRTAEPYKAHQARAVWIVDTQVSLHQVNELQKYSKQFGSRIIWTEGAGKSSPGLETLIKGGISQKSMISTKNINQGNLDGNQKLFSKIEELGTDKAELIGKATDLYLNIKQDEAILLTTNHHERLNVNNQVRAKLQQTGELTGQCIKAEMLHPLSLSTEQKRLTHCYQLGDVLRFNKDYTKLGIEKNSYFKIENIEVKDGIFELKNLFDKKIIIEPYQIDTRSIEVFRPEIRELNSGDTLLWSKTIKHDSEKKLDKINGQRAEILDIKENVATVKLSNGKVSELNLAESSDKHWDHGYAMTLGKASLQSFNNGIVLIDANAHLNKETVKDLGASIESIKNIQILTNDAEILKQNIQAVNLNTVLATDKRAAHYNTKEAISQQEKPINQSYFPKIESACLNIPNPKNAAVTPLPKDCTEDQFRKTCEAIDTICYKLSEREAVFSLEAAKKEAFSYSGLHVSREIIDFGFSKALNEDWIVNIDKGNNPKESFITTRNTYLTEKEYLDFMQKGQGNSSPILSQDSAILTTIKQHDRLTNGQKEAIELILTTSDRVVGVQGVAGSGKTTMLKEVKRLGEGSGYQILGLSNTASASNRMTEATTTVESAGIESMTTAKFLNQAEKSKFNQNLLIILDEASLTSNKEMHKLLEVTEKKVAKLVLVGDVKQMGAIEAGKPFYLLLGHGMKSACMTENVRFKNPETLKVMQDLYAARVSDAIDKLTHNLIEIPDKQERLAKMAEEYLSKSPAEQAQTLIITPLNEDRQVVNQLIRQELSHRGQLSGSSFVGQNLIQKDINQSEKTQIYSYDLGDFVRFNDSGTYGKVIKQDYKSHTLTLSLDNNKEIIWSPIRDISSESAISIYKQDTRELMAGDKLIWKLNDTQKKLFNGNLIEIVSINGSIAQIKLENKLLNIDLTQSQNQHWDYAYAVTLPVAQGRDVPLTLGHCESPKPYQKDIKELKIGDSVVLPKREFGVEKNAQSRLVTVDKMTENNLILKDREGKLYDVNPTLTQNKTWDYYPPFDQRKAHELPKSTSLNGFLVEATRGDNFKLFVDNRDYFRQTLEAHQSIKESALEHFHPDWQKVSASVNAMTASITGKAIPQNFTLNAPQAPSKSKLSKTNIDKNQVIQHLNQDSLGHATAWKGKPNKVSGREARWGKNGSFSLIIQGEKTGSWCNFESGEAGRDLIGLYMNTHGVSFKEALAQLAKDGRIIPTNKIKITPILTQNKQINDDSNDKKIAYAQEIYRKTISIQGTPAEKYLQHRGMDELPNDFRYTPNSIHPDTKKPTHALIVPIKNKQNNITGVVRIFLNKDGTKLNKIIIGEGNQPFQAVTKANLGIMKNAAVKIQSNPISDTVWVAEGIETALSIAKTKPNETVLASLSVSQLKGVPVDSNIKKIIICADNDGHNPNSRKALITAVNHHLDSGKRVFIAMPSGPEKADFNDLLRAGGEQKVLETLGNKVEIHHIKQLENNEPRLDLVLQNIRESTQKAPDLNSNRTIKLPSLRTNQVLERE
jgi:conjugative relaxase-like TrwC/TraI family protein